MLSLLLRRNEMNWLHVFVVNHWAIFTAICGTLFGVTVGAFSKGYLGEKGKQLASKKDIDKVLEELGEVTRKTQSIKSEISGGLWLKQTVWGQKRAAFGELIKALTSLQGAMRKAVSAYNVLIDGEDKDESTKADYKLTLAKKRGAFYNAVSAIGVRFIEAEIFDPTIREVRRQFYALRLQDAVKDGCTPEQYQEISWALDSYRESLMSHIRNQLGVNQGTPDAADDVM
jgi:hypothetical protein